MKKRLRKKLRIKEFHELLLHATGEFMYELEDKEIDNFLDNMCIFVDQIHCTFAGWTDRFSFDYIFSGQSKYKDRLKEAQILIIKDKINNFSFIKNQQFKINNIHDVLDDISREVIDAKYY